MNRKRVPIELEAYIATYSQCEEDAFFLGQCICDKFDVVPPEWNELTEEEQTEVKAYIRDMAIALKMIDVSK